MGARSGTGGTAPLHRARSELLRPDQRVAGSAGKAKRGPLSKQRNVHLQTVLIEAAHLAPHGNPALAELKQRELARGNPNRATLAVARKLVAYLMAADQGHEPRQMAA